MMSDISRSLEIQSGELEALNNHRHTLATTDTHRLKADCLVGVLKTVDERAHDAGPGHTKWVTECNCSAVDI